MTEDARNLELDPLLLAPLLQRHEALVEQMITLHYEICTRISSLHCSIEGGWEKKANRERVELRKMRSTLGLARAA